MTTSLSDLEALMRKRGVGCVNIHLDGQFRVFVQIGSDFKMAKGRHKTIAAALDEHFKTPPPVDLSDFL
ncbi:hypothetical protein [Rhizobium wenxiniae]|uniref:hypothetical protein n=1 Tax=Rhizobium wenxiniae TaxID=1737357 RepID=UPI003C2444D8